MKIKIESLIGLLFGALLSLGILVATGEEPAVAQDSPSIEEMASIVDSAPRHGASRCANP